MVARMSGHFKRHGFGLWAVEVVAGASLLLAPDLSQWNDEPCKQ